MKRRRVALGSLVACALTACNVAGLGGLRGSGNIKSETRDIGSFGQVVVSGDAHVFVTQGDMPALVVEVDDNLHGVRADRGGRLRPASRVCGHRRRLRPYAAVDVPPHGAPAPGPGARRRRHH